MHPPYRRVASFPHSRRTQRHWTAQRVPLSCICAHRERVGACVAVSPASCRTPILLARLCGPVTESFPPCSKKSALSCSVLVCLCCC